MSRRRNPYPALVAVALVPALLLGGCWRFAAGRAPEPAVVDAGSSGSTSSSVPVGALTTPLLSVRRAPGIVSRDLNQAAFAEALTAFLPSIDDTSCVAVSVDGKFVAGKNETVALRPASNVKLITASVALAVLGASFTYTTEVRGTVQAGVVTGDLYLVGGGDPLLNSSWWKGPNTKFPPFNNTSVESLAAAIRDAGITRIDGGIVGDASRYDDEWYAPTWGGDIRFTEGGPVSALLANDSRESNTVSSDDPAAGAATVLKNALADLGITVAGGASDGVAPAEAPSITSVSSQPLPAILQEMLTTSDNNTAEMVLKEIGLAKGGAGTREAGLAVVVDTLTGWGVPMDGVTLVDGSGLSDENRLTCNALLAVLQHQAADDPIGQGLAKAGQEGGTLNDAFVGSPLEGVLLGKTGTLSNYADGVGGRPGAKSLCGYVPLDGGGAIEFAMVLNGPQIVEKVNYRPIWDAFGAVVAAYPSGPGAAELGPR